MVSNKTTAATGYPHSAATHVIEQELVLKRLGWQQRFKELLRPDLRKKRALEEFAISQHILVHVENPIEPPSLPGAGLHLLREREDKSPPTTPIDESDVELTRGDDEDDMTALPPMPDRKHSPSVSCRTSWSLSMNEEDNADQFSVDDLADEAMDEALAVADAPGNRSSIRPTLPAEWIMDWPSTPKSTRAAAGPITEQQTPMKQTGRLHLSSTMYSPMTSPTSSFFNFSTRGSRASETSSEVEEDVDTAQKTLASCRWFIGGSL